jgi:hypothetical protein
VLLRGHPRDNEYYLIVWQATEAYIHAIDAVSRQGRGGEGQSAWDLATSKHHSARCLSAALPYTGGGKAY